MINHNWFIRFVCLLFFASLISACNGPLFIAKRRYEPGFYVQWPSNKGVESIHREPAAESPLLATVDSSLSIQPIYNEIESNDNNDNNEVLSTAEPIQPSSKHTKIVFDTTGSVAQLPDTLEKQLNAPDADKKNLSNFLGVASVFAAFTGTLAWLMAIYGGAVGFGNSTSGLIQMLLIPASFLLSLLGLVLSIAAKNISKENRKDLTTPSLLAKIGKLISFINLAVILALGILLGLLILILLIFYKNTSIGL